MLERPGKQRKFLKEREHIKTELAAAERELQAAQAEDKETLRVLEEWRKEHYPSSDEEEDDEDRTSGDNDNDDVAVGGDTSQMDAVRCDLFPAEESESDDDQVNVARGPDGQINIAREMEELAATDTTALATTVGAYHLSPDTDLAKTMKVILTNTNNEWDSVYNIQQILMHWSAPFNRNVEPGSFLWLEDYNLQPMQSTQIFSEFMDEAMLNSVLEPVDGTNFTTAILSGTTIENQSFSVQAGQAVEILLININTPIPTLIASPLFIETLKGPMGDMVIDIATNPELLARVNAFLDLGGGENIEEEEGGKGIDGTGIRTTSSSQIRDCTVFAFVLPLLLGALF